jgi:hypothetical protein
MARGARRRRLARSNSTDALSLAASLRERRTPPLNDDGLQVCTTTGVKLRGPERSEGHVSFNSLVGLPLGSLACDGRGRSERRHRTPIDSSTPVSSQTPAAPSHHPSRARRLYSASAAFTIVSLPTRHRSGATPFRSKPRARTSASTSGRRSAEPVRHADTRAARRAQCGRRRDA